MKHVIKYLDGHVVEVEADTFMKAVEAHKANLTMADLTRADLADADLSRANLAGADLAGADLRGANTKGAAELIIRS